RAAVDHPRDGLVRDAGQPADVRHHRRARARTGLAVATVHGGRTLAAVVRAGSAAVISGSTYVRPGSSYVIPGLHLSSSRGSPYPRRPRIPLVDGGMLALTARPGIRSRRTPPTSKERR